MNIVNRKHFAGIIVFDQWVNNIDRRKRNILLRPISRNRDYQLFMIDQGHSFSYFDDWTHKRECRWTPETLRFLPQKLKSNAFYRWCKRQSREKDFAHYLDIIRQLSDEQIRQVIASIPKDWKVAQVEREALYDSLIRSKQMLPDLIRSYLHKTDEQPGRSEKNAQPFLSEGVRRTTS